MLKIGVIGCGHWGPNFIRNFNQLPNVCVWGVADLDKRRLEHIKEIYPFVNLFSDYKTIVDNDTVDAVVIATPAITHYSLAKEALNKNKHVLVEKPLALQESQARELIFLSKKNKKILMVGHTFMYNPAIKKIREIIKNGDLGKIYYLHSRRTNLGPFRKDVSALGDLAPHDVSIFSYLLEINPTEVMARGQHYLQKHKEDIAFATLIYPNRIIANIHVSWLDPRKVREVTIVGSKKMLVFDDLNEDKPLHLYDRRVIKKKYKHDYDTFNEFQMLIKENGVITPKVRKEEPLKNECKYFLECIRKNKKPLTDGKSGLDVLKVLVGLQESIDKKGKAVRIIKK